MKLKTIIGLIAIAGFSSLLLFSFGKQVGAYMDFAEAEASGARAHVVGTWVLKDQAHYDPVENLFSFFMEDDLGATRLVRYANTKPASFEDAEKLVVEGHLEDDVFVAEHILMKCPSKYNDERALQAAEPSQP